MAILRLPIGFQIQPLNLLPRPRGFSEKFQTGANTGVFAEAVEVDQVRQALPAVVFNQLGQ